MYPNGATAEQAEAMHQKYADIYVDGVLVPSGIQFWNDNGKVLLLLKYDKVQTGVTSYVDMKAHNVVLKAGTVIGSCKLTSDYAFYVDKGMIAAGEKPSMVVNPGDVLIENPNNQTSVTHVFNEKLHAGTKVTFDVQLSEVRNFAVWFLGEGSWDNAWHAKGYTNTDTASITVDIPKDLDSYTIQIQYRDAQEAPDEADKTHMQTVIRNLTVHNGNKSIGRNGEITLTNPNHISRVEYVFDTPVPVGSVISLDVEGNGVTDNYAVFIIGRNGLTELETSTMAAVGDGPTTVTSAAATQAYSGFRVLVEFRNPGVIEQYNKSDLADCVATIRNVKVQSGDAATTYADGGKVTLTNTAGTAGLKYAMHQEIKAGSTLKFDVDFLDWTNPCALWVLNNDSWETGDVFYEYGYGEWNGKKTITVNITKDITNAVFQVQFRDANSSATSGSAVTGKKVEITNIEVIPPSTSTTPITFTGVHPSAQYVADAKRWDVYLWVSDELENYDVVGWYDSIKIDVGGKVRTMKLNTTYHSASLLYFHLESSDFPNGMLDNTIITIYADQAERYMIGADGTAMEKAGETLELTSETKLYLNEHGISMAGFITRSTSSVSPSITGYTASTIDLAFTADMKVGGKLIAKDAESGIYLNGTKLANAYIMCNAEGAYTLHLGQSANAGDKVVLRGTLATENGNYEVTFVTTQFTYSNDTGSLGWAVTEYIPLGSTGKDGDVNADNAFNTADLVRYLKHLKDDTTSVNDIDGDLNGTGTVTEKDASLCKLMLLGVYTFADGSNITPGAPTYATKDANNEDIEIALGAYCGPRRLGQVYYDSGSGYELVSNRGTTQTDYRAMASEWEKYAAAGFNFVLSEGDASYGSNWSTTGTPAGTASFVGSDLYNYMQMADSVGVDVIVSSGVLNELLRSSEAVTTDDMNRITSMIADLQTMDNFKGVSMADEPIIDYAANYTKLADTIRKQAPEAQLFTSLRPNYTEPFADNTGYAEYMSTFGEIHQNLTYDFYPFNKKESWPHRDNFRQTNWFKNLELSSSTAYGQYDTGLTIQSMAHAPTSTLTSGAFRYQEVDQLDVAFQAYSALAYGNKTIAYFTYWTPAQQSKNEVYSQSMVEYPSSEGQGSVETALYGYVKNVNTEIKQFDHVMMDFNWQGTIYHNVDGVSSTYGNKRIASHSATGDAVIGCLQDSNGYDGFMMVNAADPDDNASTTVNLTFNNANRALVYTLNGNPDDQLMTDVALTDGKYSVTIGAGQAVFVIPYM